MAKKAKKAKAAVELEQRMAAEAACMGPEYGPASTDADLAAVVEAVEDVVTELESATVIEHQPAEQPQDFADVLAAVSSEDVNAKVEATRKALTERSDFERVKDPDNGKIQKPLDRVWKQITTQRAARLMCAVSFDPETLNRVIHEGARYNVYAMGKLGDAIWGLTNSEDGKRGQITNAINLACMRSLFRFRADGTQFTGEMAKAAASDKIRVDAKVRELLVRHTVSASTAPTQASSTMQALESLGIVRRSGSGTNPNFDLTANPIVGALEKALAA